MSMAERLLTDKRPDYLKSRLFSHKKANPLGLAVMRAFSALYILLKAQGKIAYLLCLMLH